MKIRFEKRQYPLKEGHIDWIRVYTHSPKGIVFIPPLIGGDYSQQIRIFRSLIMRGYDIVSFNYSGHGGSTDKFSLEATLRDTRNILEHTVTISMAEKLPLYAAASCYSAIPLFYSARYLSEPIKKLVLINAIPELKPKAVIKSFILYYREIYRSQNRIPKIMEAIRHYADFMFPGIVKSRNSFGMLERQRTRMFKTVYDFFTLNPIKDICLNDTHVLCLYSVDDRILQIYDSGSKMKYKDHIRKICPKVKFQPLAGDHFLSHQVSRKRALRAVFLFLDDTA